MKAHDVHVSGRRLGLPIDTGASCFIVDPTRPRNKSGVQNIPSVDLDAFGGDVKISAAANVDFPALHYDCFPSLLLEGGPEAASLGVMVSERRYFQIWHPDYGFHIWNGQGDEVPSFVHNNVPHLLDDFEGSTACSYLAKLDENGRSCEMLSIVSNMSECKQLELIGRILLRNLRLQSAVNGCNIQ